MKTNGGRKKGKRDFDINDGTEGAEGQKVEECQQKSELCKRGNESAHTHECAVRSLADLWQQGRLWRKLIDT